MTPNILEAMKWTAHADEFVWFDLGYLTKQKMESAQARADSGEFLCPLYTVAPADIPMPFEKFGVVLESPAISADQQGDMYFAATFDREGNDMQVVFRHPSKKHLVLTQEGDKSARGEEDMWFGGELLDAIMKMPKNAGKSEKDIIAYYSGIARCFYWILLAELTDKKKRTTAYTPLPNPANDKRVRKGKKPLFEWKVIDVTAQHVAADNAAPTGRTHASPRRHVRRGHQRKLANGKTIWIKQMMVGKIEFGYIHHSYTTGESK
jgi:hypothetical protein